MASGMQLAGARTAVSAELAVLLPTSGSTGSSKLVRLSAGNLQANAQSIQDYLGIDSAQRAITSLPMHYSYGLSVINSHLLAGATLLLTAESVVSRSFWDFSGSTKRRVSPVFRPTTRC